MGMNEIEILSFLRGNIFSINQLDITKFKRYRLRHYQRLSIQIPVFNTCDKCILTDSNSVYTYIFSPSPIYGKGTIFSYTRLKLSGRAVLIPKSFDVIMEAILLKDLRVTGLFRKPSAASLVKECKSFTLSNLTATKSTLIDGLRRFDELTLTTVFKIMFDEFQLIFPLSFKKYFLYLER